MATVRRKYGSYRTVKLPNGAWYLESIYVEREYRCKGIGTALMRDVIARHPGTIYLLATGELGGDPAHLFEFYSRFGFRRARDKDDLPFDYNMIRTSE